ncbi:MAG: hypothetical protein KJ737_07975 [Proteobacteria bacterium]|nr:hypothetical protein [Pseudomonadota bacterium]
MKKLLGISGVFGMIFMVFSQPCFAMNMSGVTITGEINAIMKIQDSYQTPLDMFSEREGANYRSDQNFRGFGNFVLSYGDPGASDWFAAAKITFDANDPDIDDNDYFDASDSDYQKNNRNYSNYNFEMEYAFVMYRPFEMQGGRPFGIMAGMIPIKATANAAYFNFFKADPEEDFIVYTCTALTEVPGIGLDFHISENTGVGVAFARGVKDASELGALMMSDSAENWIFWAEANQYNIGFNFAYQLVKGEGNASDAWTTDADNVLYEYGQSFSHHLINTQLTYSLGVGNLKFMPAVAYQLIKGEECQAVAGYDPRDVEIATLSYGLKIGTNFFNIPGELSILYTDIMDRKNFGGVKSIPKGSIASDIKASGVLELFGLPDVPDIPEEGKGEGVLALMEVSSDIHAEYAFKVNSYTEIGLFYYKLNTVNDRTKYSPYIKNQLQSSLGGIYPDIVISGIADNVASQLQTLEWTDTESYGLFARIMF